MKCMPITRSGRDAIPKMCPVLKASRSAAPSTVDHGTIVPLAMLTKCSSVMTTIAVVERIIAPSMCSVAFALAVNSRVLLRRSGARAVTLGLLATASERAVAARTGIPMLPRERFWNALWARAPELAGELAEAENALYGSAGQDAELLKVAQRLHDVAYPVSSGRRPARQTESKEVR